MGLGVTTQETTSSIPGMDASARRIQELLLRQAEEAAGTLREPISTQATPEQLRQIAQIQESTGEQARSQMLAGLEESSQFVEAQALDRGIEGSTIEAVNQAINQRDQQRQMNEMIMASQGQAAGQALNAGFANANIQLNRNQQLLQQLLGGGQTIMGGDIQQRLAQGTTRGMQDVGTFGALSSFGAELGGNIVGSAIGAPGGA